MPWKNPSHMSSTYSDPTPRHLPTTRLRSRDPKRRNPSFSPFRWWVSFLLSHPSASWWGEQRSSSRVRSALKGLFLVTFVFCICNSIEELSRPSFTVSDLRLRSGKRSFPNRLIVYPTGNEESCVSRLLFRLTLFQLLLVVWVGWPTHDYWATNSCVPSREVSGPRLRVTPINAWRDMGKSNILTLFL